MLKKLFIVLVVVLLSGLLAASVAADEWSGAGSIHCEGDGLALLIGDGEVTLAGERGLLGFKDQAGDGQIVVDGRGRKRERPNGTTFWYGFEGTAQASGSRIIVGLRGGQITLDAEGQGYVRAAGEGFCQVGDQVIQWTNTLQTFELGQ